MRSVELCVCVCAWVFTLARLWNGKRCISFLLRLGCSLLNWKFIAIISEPLQEKILPRAREETFSPPQSTAFIVIARFLLLQIQVSSLLPSSCLQGDANVFSVNRGKQMVDKRFQETMKHTQAHDTQTHKKRENHYCAVCHSLFKDLFAAKSPRKDGGDDRQAREWKGSTLTRLSAKLRFKANDTRCCSKLLR